MIADNTVNAKDVDVLFYSWSTSNRILVSTVVNVNFN